MQQLENTPLVSIVTPSYNHAAFLERTILSVLQQDYANIEYVLVDAASKDGTKAILNRYKKKISHIICEKDNGQADAINKGFKKTSGPIMAYINSDDCYAAAGVVSRAVQLFQENPDVDVLYGRRLFIDEEGKFVLHYPYREFDAKALELSCFIPQECVFWRRSIYDRVGGFIDASFQFALDYDLWLRFVDAGAKFLTVNEFFGLFRWYSGQKSQLEWLSHGLPEITKLQEKRLGRRQPADEMISEHFAYMYGIGNLSNATAWEATYKRWQLLSEMHRSRFENSLLDSWVYRSDCKRKI
jgi:glycosyltransferase involved in cell wall biosynthesis